jgi:hypothetical protein
MALGSHWLEDWQIQSQLFWSMTNSTLPSGKLLEILFNAQVHSNYN